MTIAKATIEEGVLGVLKDMTQDWDLDNADDIGLGTKLMGDLSFESIEVVQFAVALENKFERKGLPFEQLFMQDGDYVEDLTVGQVVEFLDTQLN